MNHFAQQSVLIQNFIGQRCNLHVQNSSAANTTAKTPPQKHQKHHHKSTKNTTTKTPKGTITKTPKKNNRTILFNNGLQARHRVPMSLQGTIYL